VAAGCGLGKSGTATVSAEFDVLECQPGDEESGLEDYRFVAGYMSTERYAGILLVMIQRHRVNVEETDGVVIRMKLDDLLEQGLLHIDSERDLYTRVDTGKPLSLPITLAEADVNVSLSLFQTCPDFPTHNASGRLELSAIEIARDPMDTGRNEHLAGTITATLTRANAEGRVGELRAAFDFAPPRRPLTDFK
jgi:hypothetical protein